jgi:palmitoyltransferase
VKDYFSGKHPGSTGWIRYTPPMTGFEIMVFLVVVVTKFLLLFTVGILCVWQLFYAGYNTTTIESFENNTIDDMKRRKQIPNNTIYPFDLGVVNNFRCILGKNMLSWLVPQSMTGDGVTFEVRADGTIPWPPREYYLHKKYPGGKKHMKHNPLVQKDKEGYLVKQLSAEDRERLLNKNYEDADSQDYVSSTDYDSLESDEEIDDDDQPLYERKKHLKSQ